MALFQWRLTTETPQTVALTSHQLERASRSPKEGLSALETPRNHVQGGDARDSASGTEFQSKNKKVWKRKPFPCQTPKRKENKNSSVYSDDNSDESTQVTQPVQSVLQSSVLSLFNPDPLTDVVCLQSSLRSAKSDTEKSASRLDRLLFS